MKDQIGVRYALVSETMLAIGADIADRRVCVRNSRSLVSVTEPGACHEEGVWSHPWCRHLVSSSKIRRLVADKPERLSSKVMLLLPGPPQNELVPTALSESRLMPADHRALTFGWPSTGPADGGMDGRLL